MATSKEGLDSQHFSPQSQVILNKQINIELNASYIYKSFSVYFDRPDQALSGIAAYFEKQSEDGRMHAEKANKCIIGTDKFSPLEAFERALEMEYAVSDEILSAYNATSHCPSLSSFLTQFVDDQVESVAEMTRMVSTAKFIGRGIGDYHFSKDI